MYKSEAQGRNVDKNPLVMSAQAKFPKYLKEEERKGLGRECLGSASISSIG